MYIISSLSIKKLYNINSKIIHSRIGKFKTKIRSFNLRRYTSESNQRITKKKKNSNKLESSTTQDVNDTQKKEIELNSSNTIQFNSALFESLQAGNFEMAERIWNLICQRNIPKTIFTYRYGIKLLVHLGKIDEAKENAYEALKLYPSNASLFSSIIEHYCRQNDIKEVLEIYDNLKEKNVTLDSKSICNIINLLAVNKRYFQGIKIFEEYNNVNSDRVAMIVYNSIYRCYIELQLYDKAVEVYKSMKQKVPKKLIRYSLETLKFICFIEAYTSNHLKLVKFFQYIKDSYGSINNDHLFYSLRAFYHKQDKESFVSILKYAYNYMITHGHSVSYLRLNMSLLNEFIKLKELKYSEILFETAQKCNKDYMIDLQSFYPKLAKVYLECGLEDKALKLFEELNLSSSENDEDISTTFFYYYLKVKDIQKAKFYLKFLPEKEIPIARLQLLCASNNLDQAYNYFIDVFVNNHKDKNSILNAFHILFTSYIDNDMADEAEKLYYSVNLLDIEPNLTTLFCSLQLIMKTNSLETFLRNYENIKESNYFSPNVRIFNTVIEAYVKHKKYEEAQQFFFKNYAPNGIVPNEYTLPLIQETITESTDDDTFRRLDEQFRIAGLKLKKK